MPLFSIRRDMTGMDEEQLEAASMRAAFCTYLFDERLHWIRSYFDAERHELRCIYEAASADDIREHARLAQVPCDEVTEVRELLAEPYLETAADQGGAEAPALEALLRSQTSR